MKITFIPQRRDDYADFTVLKNSERITINGDSIDLSVIPDGATLPAGSISNPNIIGDVERIDGDLHINLALPLGPNPDQKHAFPEDWIDPPNGYIIFRGTIYKE